MVEEKKLENIEQIVGKKGGVVQSSILWLVHSGTTNQGGTLARYDERNDRRFSEDAFVYHGMRVLNDNDEDNDDENKNLNGDNTGTFLRREGTTLTKAFYSSNTFSEKLSQAIRFNHHARAQRRKVAR